MPLAILVAHDVNEFTNVAVVMTLDVPDSLFPDVVDMLIAAVNDAIEESDTNEERVADDEVV